MTTPDVQDPTTIHDIAIIGGGVNGAGIARDASGRGLSVVLLEKGDLAQGTSAASTKLIHGGLRYLEHFEFRLVREALMEREVLWAMAPHIIWPLRFVLPHHKGLRPWWMLRLGLFLYDYIGGRQRLPATTALDFDVDPAGPLLDPGFDRGFEYSDCWVDDARLVLFNAMDARDNGADIRTRCQVDVAHRVEQDGQSLWRLICTDQNTGEASAVLARTLVNAAGPWAEHVFSNTKGATLEGGMRLVRGSHIIVPKIAEEDRAFIFQNSDGRIVFAIPYEEQFTLIGTTDVDVGDDPTATEPSTDEIAYLCEAVSGYLAKDISTDDVVGAYGGIRPLYDDGASNASKATRDYVLSLDVGEDDNAEPLAPVLSVFGGKITTYRRLAEEALHKLEPYLGWLKPAWTANSTLPGGDFPHDGFEGLCADLRSRYPFLPDVMLVRIAHAHGTNAYQWLGDAESLDDLGRCYGDHITDAELQWFVDQEWAESADDVLWRRTKLQLHLSSRDRGTVGRAVARMVKAKARADAR